MTPREALRYFHNPAEIIEALESKGFVIGPATEIERLRSALEKIEPFLAGAAYSEQSSPPFQEGRACAALRTVRDALAKPQ